METKIIDRFNSKKEFKPVEIFQRLSKTTNTANKTGEAIIDDVPMSLAKEIVERRTLQLIYAGSSYDLITDGKYIYTGLWNSGQESEITQTPIKLTKLVIDWGEQQRNVHIDDNLNLNELFSEIELLLPGNEQDLIRCTLRENGKNEVFQGYWNDGVI